MSQKRAIQFLILIAVMMLRGLAYGQTREIDSLENLLKTSLPDTQRLKVINHVVYYYNDMNSKRATELSAEAMTLIKGTTNKFDIANAYINRALSDESNGLYLSSLSNNFKAYSVFENMSDSAGLSACLNNIGVVYNQLGDYSMAVYHLLRAIEIDELRHDTLSAGLDYINLAEAYFEANNYPEAITCAKKAFHDLGTMRDFYSQGYAAETLALILIEMNKLDSVRYYIRLSQDVGTKYHSEYLVHRNDGHLGKLFLKLGQYDSSKFYLQKVIGESAGKHYSDVLIPAMTNLARCYIIEKNYSQAEKVATESLAMSKGIKNKHAAIESIGVLVEISRKLDKPAVSYQYLSMATQYKDTLIDQLQKGSIEAKAFDIKLDKERRARLKAQQDLEIQNQLVLRQRVVIFLIGALVVSLIAMLLVIRKSVRDKKKANEKLVLINDELTKLNQEIRGLVNTIVHDLKSPLNSLQGLLFVIEQEVKENENAAELINHSHRVLKGAHEIIQQLLELRAIEENSYAIQMEPIEVQHFVRELKNDFDIVARQKNIELVAEAAEATISTDRTLLRRIMENLVSNAIKFSPTGKQVIIRTWTQNGQAYFQVSDQGPGFSQSDMQRIYGKFQKLSARPTGGESSHGLGLATVNVLTKELKGTIVLETEAGKGASFTIEIPAIYAA
ncbi:MAG: tetratricopeptide repeat-containing sensor histidine kinase [Flammeovirgaceae bacterium]|nr:tetratricopeptide repeat-containing sensor histidine kinase [Flammeovirgaceae bacterium]